MKNESSPYKNDFFEKKIKKRKKMKIDSLELIKTGSLLGIGFFFSNNIGGIILDHLRKDNLYRFFSIYTLKDFIMAGCYFYGIYQFF